jgi:hypothetical protein
MVPGAKQEPQPVTLPIARTIASRLGVTSTALSSYRASPSEKRGTKSAPLSRIDAPNSDLPVAMTELYSGGGILFFGQNLRLANTAQTEEQ